MPDKPDNQKQPTTNIGDAQRIYILIGELIFNFFDNPKILDLLIIKPIIGNLIVASLVTFTGFSIFEKNNSEKIDAQSMCERTRTQVASQRNIDSSDIKDLSAKATSSKSSIENQLFSCQYKIQEKPNSPISTKEYHIVYQVLRNELVASIQEKKITKESLQKICQKEDIYTKKLSKQQQYDQNKHKIEEKGLELQEDKEDNKDTVYPVFRWKCKYAVTSKTVQPLKKPGAQPQDAYVGLDLDKYCEEKFAKEKFTKATHHHYNDPDSLYCVNPNF